MTSALTALTDPDLVPPPAPAGSTEPDVAWLRAAVARFADGEAHRRRRELAVRALDRLNPPTLRSAAQARTTAVLAAATTPVELMADIARPVPVAVLAEALGLTDARTRDVTTVAAAYPSGASVPGADLAVARLVTACGGVADEPTAARIGLLAQTHDATAGLIGNAFLADDGRHTVEELITATLRADPPVLATRRQSVRRLGPAIRVDLTDPPLPFGAGPHACPGREPALALAAGVVAALRGRRPRDRDLAYEASPDRRIPLRIVLA